MPLYQSISHIASGLPARPAGGEPRTASFQEAIFWLRFWSAAAGTLTIYLVYKISQYLSPNYPNHPNYSNPSYFPLLAALLAALTPGLVQASHFGTTEALLAFFFMLIVYLSIKLLQKKHNDRYLFFTIIFLGLVAGLALATKLTAVYFLPVPFIALFLIRLQNKISNIQYLISNLVFFIFTLSFFIFSSPYSILESQEFRRISTYETEVATGKIQIFYTRQFIDTTPLLFQATHIFPHALGLPLFIIGSFGMLYLLISNSKFLPRRLAPPTRGRHSGIPHVVSHRPREEVSVLRGLISKQIPNPKSQIPNKFLNIGSLDIEHYLDQLPARNSPISNKSTLLLLLAFLAYFIPNSLLFAKWTRFMTPTFPFFAIFAAYFLYVFSQKKPPIARGLFSVGKGAYSLPSDTLPVHSPLTSIITIFLIFLSIIPGVLFFSIYTRPDVRIAASNWIYTNVPDGSYILSEAGNVVDLPIATQGPALRGYDVINFDFYHLDENQQLFAELTKHLAKADYLIVPSRRIFANHTRLPHQFPLSTNYYQALFSGKLGFELVQICEKGTCSSVPTGRNNLLKQIKRPSHVKIFNFVRDEVAEETWSVFDHPVIRVFKKTKQYDQKYYQQLLNST